MAVVFPAWVEKMDVLYSKGIPFFAVIGFDREVGQVYDADACAQSNIYYDFNGINNIRLDKGPWLLPEFEILKPSFSDYHKKFNQVQKEIEFGNTYLLNLCFATSLKGNIDLLSLFHLSQAPFRLFFRNEFLVFSPERFVSWKDNRISTYPMKGTIDASIPNARDVLQGDSKEKAEHYTVVDLLRNDLGSVCEQIEVENFGYVSEVITHKGPVLQMSSSISGRVKATFQNHPGQLFYSILPAGSISGAPKSRTVEIIRGVEKFDRKYYTGVMVLYDGKSIDSAIMIRFIERDNQGNYWYKSGGGITFMSDVHKEYEELLRKIYLPIF